MSLLSSRDEVFKGIQDVGEDNSLSSLLLFFGNVDLPSSSYHDSLGELLDEEEAPEKIETVMKLEGSLPPIGVIYSLPNQESDTLRAYISENLEKCFMRPSSSSTEAPVFFVKKKDGGLSLCVDYFKLNDMNRKKNYPVPPMNDLLTVFNGSSIFSKIDLGGAYKLLRIKEGDENLTAFGAKYGTYEYLVVPSGLTNAPSSFQNLSNNIFYYLLDVYVVPVIQTPTGLHNSSNPSLPTIGETNAFNYALGAVLSQVSDSGKRPIAFDSPKPIPAELNYEIHDKELLGIVWALLLSLSSPFEAITNHSSLQYFMSSKVLTRRQARWDEFLSESHFSIIYFPG
ncbi:hypothetical protein O181_001786 [Austropuccinia psidii MF-1]|uniref:Reverse transcriptase domain-containing protein n=1 Tax=Austropuccinia psidii MF-1 TaxID=1389203 RepID=A0A9Q3GCR2_9BASI|nr:hypothetical protein [Austropuccinia psidii MF-1]